MERDEAAKEQLRLWAMWLAGCLVLVFFSAFFISQGYGGALLAIMISGPVVVVSWIALAGHQLGVTSRIRVEAPRRRRSLAALTTIRSIGAANLFLVLAVPTLWLSAWVEPYLVLAANKVGYDRRVVEQLRKPLPERDDILLWNYGGSFSSDLDIVWDPLARPEERVPIKQQGGTATCHWLMTYYYSCYTDY